MTEDMRVEEIKEKVRYYEDTASILLDEGIYDIAVDFFTLAGLYSLSIDERKNGEKYIEKALEICRTQGVTGHRELFAGIGVKLYGGKYEEAEADWEKIKSEYSEEEDQLIKKIIGQMREATKTVSAEAVSQSLTETMPKGEGEEASEWEYVPVQDEVHGETAQPAEGVSKQVGVTEASVSVEEQSMLKDVSVNVRNPYSRIHISEIAWRVGQNIDYVRQVLNNLIQSGRIPGRIEGDEYVQSGTTPPTFQMPHPASPPSPQPQSTGSPSFLEALREKDITAPTRPGYKRCGVCGEEIPGWAKVCPHCGARQ